MVYRIFLLFLLVCTAHLLSAQNFVFRPNAFGANRFFGGTETPRFQFTDIDGDNDHDLFIFDRDERLWFFRNSNGAFTVDQNVSFNLTIAYWFRFVDIDGDGDLDCFTSNSSVGTDYYKNIGTKQNPSFILAQENISDTTNNNLVFVEPMCVPSFADIDGDGDLDFFTGSSSGSITYYQNIGTQSNFQFKFITSQFQDIVLNSGPAAFPKQLHGSSAIEFFDADSNGTADIFWGDLFNRSMYYLKNNGTKFVPNIALHDSSYPKPDTIVTLGLNMPQHVDIDNDGKIDLLSASLYGNSSDPDFWFYKNHGSNVVPEYSVETKNFLPMIDMGTRSAAAPADFDSDGDIDLAVSSAGGRIGIFQNSGTKFIPVYSSLPASTISVNGTFYNVVTAGDINADNKPDLVMGSFDGGLVVFINTSSGGNISFALQSHPLNAINVGQNSAPHIVDIDNNGTKDILIGNNTGQMTLAKNTGTNISPVYVAESFFQSIDVGNDAIPFVTDIDNDGRRDLLIGNTEGAIHHYRESSSAAGTFELVTKKFGAIELKLQSAPSAADIDFDGDLDLLIGNWKGGILLYEQNGGMSIGDPASRTPEKFQLKNSFPNPFNPSTTIPFTLASESVVSLRVFDILGREVRTLIKESMDAGEHSVVWNAIDLPSGTYYIHLLVQHDNGVFHQTKITSLIK